MKTHTRWRVRAGPKGELVWISPHGGFYRTHPGTWTDPPDLPAWLDCEQDEPPDPAVSWTDEQYQAWVDAVCARAEAAEAAGEAEAAEATGPDLPLTWWAGLLTSWFLQRQAGLGPGGAGPRSLGGAITFEA